MPSDFQFVFDPQTGERFIKTSLTAKSLMTTPQLNKGSAFTLEERKQLGLWGKLPYRVETLEQQKVRAYQQLNEFKSDMQRHIYLNALHDTNQVLFYALVLDHLEELMPLIYTPYVGTGVQTFSEQFRKARGLFLNYEDRDHFVEILENRTNPEVKLIVVTDGEAVLGIGDQGVGSINIPIAKLMVYSLCGGINPAYTLPIVLDVGTDNEILLNDPFYLGWRNPRLRGQEYENLIDCFIDAIRKVFPNAFLHWEDFAAMNARANQAKANNYLCSFNDDIQGTGAVAVATVFAALKALKADFYSQRIVLFGAGTAGVGIAEQIILAMKAQGMTDEEAYSRFWLIDREGLLCEDSNLKTFQKPFARKVEEQALFNRNEQGLIDLQEVVNMVKPTILIGASSVSGAFKQDIIQTMAKYVERPMILALSNPNAKAEIHPLHALEWTNGKALIATGSPFGIINFQGKSIRIAQCNNAFIFPGIGLGVLAVNAKKLTNQMLSVASLALSEFAPALQNLQAPLLPDISQAREVATAIAFAVAKQAIIEGVAVSMNDEDLKSNIEKTIWYPQYIPIKPKL